MALIVKNNFIKEDIKDENGNKLGEIKFNPNDSRIMSKLTKIVNELGNSLDKLKSMGNMPKIPNEDLNTLEDFEKVSDSFKLIEQGFDIEEKAVDCVLDNLSEVFGEETINIFTGGTKDVLSVMPLIEYILPFVKEARQNKINKYINKKTSNDVME